jgi:hypothetical protein
VKWKRGYVAVLGNIVAPQNLIRTYGDLKGGPDGPRRRPTVPIMFACSSPQFNIICAWTCRGWRDVFPRIRFWGATSRALETGSRPGSGAQAEKRNFINGRLEGMRAFFAIVDSSIGAFTQGQSVAPQEMQKVIQFAGKQIVRKR